MFLFYFHVTKTWEILHRTKYNSLRSCFGGKSTLRQTVKPIICSNPASAASKIAITSSKVVVYFQTLLLSTSLRLYVQGVFLTVPPNFQYQNENRWAANKRFCSMKFSMYKRSLLVEQRFSFWYWNLGGTFKKSTLYNCLIQNSPVISNYIFYFDIVEKMVLWLTPI